MVAMSVEQLLQRATSHSFMQYGNDAPSKKNGVFFIEVFSWKKLDKKDER